jgi:Kef-type K+ transport system membrane component KefB
MSQITFSGLALVVAAGFLAPFLVGLVPRLALPSVVLEIVFGIVIGPSVLGWVEIDAAIEVMALVGLSFLLLIAGLEVDYDRFRGRLLGITGAAFLASFGLALAAGFALAAGGLVQSPLLIAIVLSATGLGIVIPVLKDTNQISTGFGQVVVAGASIAEIATIVLLSLFFSGMSTGVGSKIVLLGGFALLLAAIGLTLVEAERSRRISRTLRRLQDTTAQIRVRGAFLVLAIFVVAAERFGLEAILGAFMAGAIIKLVDRDQGMTHPEFRGKLEAVGFGVFIPIFFVASGVRFDLAALGDGSTLARVPIFLALLLLVRGLPALLYRALVEGRSMIAAAGLLQATSLGFLIVASRIGVELDLISEGSATALVAAGLLSVIIFPLAALTLLRGTAARPGTEIASPVKRLAPAAD